ncbi:MAG: helix-turn-helix domain-containing protein [Thermomicrobiales bacterium]|nr:helix-turn-helix domain-containing protein [Thermomicrobiales bacterium]
MRTETFLICGVIVHGYHPTGQPYSLLLEILQDRPGISGPELAERLDVSTRTVRRYIVTLQDMGIPVEPTPVDRVDTPCDRI